jgi:uncharacterized protein (DUF58 family)
VSLDVEVRRRSRAPVGAVVLEAELEGLGARQLRLGGRGRRSWGQLELGPLTRGAYDLGEPRVVLWDHLGLGSVSTNAGCGPTTVLVRPHLEPLDHLFGDAGPAGGERRRLQLRRTAGFDLLSVRRYEQGESLRRVHWPTSARRGELMVKELEDAPQDRVLVLLDCDPAGVVGEPPDSSFEAAVRAAGSIACCHAARGRRVLLATTGSERVPVRVGGGEGGLEPALDALAAVAADAPHPLSRVLARDAAVPEAGEVVVVTSTPDGKVVGSLLALAARRLVSIVWVDAASWGSGPTRHAPVPLRLGAAGLPLAVVRRGDRLAHVLGAHPPEDVARA